MLPRTTEEMFSLYFSHSWRAHDVDLNVALWALLADRCHLLVDGNASARPPYFVNRIEEYVRRSDLFFAVLTRRDEENEPPRCSKSSLFEVRLAERARKPRFVLYERGTLFTPPDEPSELVRYQMFDRHDVLVRNNSGVASAVADWLQAVRRKRHPRELNPTEASLALLPHTAGDVLQAVRRALLEGGYTRCHAVGSQTTDFEVMNQLAGTGLLVADMTVTDNAEVLAMAHALFVPTIRIARVAPDGTHPALPWYLRGHPAMGYDKDVVYYLGAEDLEEPLRLRAQAMIDTREPIKNLKDGNLFFNRRRWRPHKVFISHALKLPRRELVDRLLAAAKASGLDMWEYRGQGVAGVDWHKQLDEELDAATHAVLLVDDAYNDSEACHHEVTRLGIAGRQLPLFPFLLDGYQGVAVGAGSLHQESLKPDVDEAVNQILARLTAALRA